jgi:hypothetical protein
MDKEALFFQSGDITVTNARFIIGAQTFAIRGITSVEGVETPAKYTGAILLAAFGVGIISLGFIHSSFVLGILGLLIIGAGIWLGVRQKPKYTIVLRTAGGEVEAYESNNRKQVSKIIEALNEAIVSQG